MTTKIEVLEIRKLVQYSSFHVNPENFTRLTKMTFCKYPTRSWWFRSSPLPNTVSSNSSTRSTYFLWSVESPRLQSPTHFTKTNFYIPWHIGDFLPEFAPEWADSYLLTLEKPNGHIRDIDPEKTSIGRTQGHSIVQEVQTLDGLGSQGPWCYY